MQGFSNLYVYKNTVFESSVCLLLHTKFLQDLIFNVSSKGFDNTSCPAPSDLFISTQISDVAR